MSTNELPSIEDEMAKLQDEELLSFLEKEEESVQEVKETPSKEAQTEETSEVEKLVDEQNISTDDAEKALKTGYNPNLYDPEDPNSKSVMEYNRMGEMIHKLEKAVGDLKSKDDMITHMVDKFKDKEELAYKRALHDLETKRAEAVEQGDLEQFNRIDSEHTRAQQDLADLQVSDVDPEATKLAQLADNFQKRNVAWYNDDSFDNSQMKEFAIKYDQYLTQQNPGREASENLKEVEMEVRRKYADHPAFKNLRQDMAPVMSQNEGKTHATESKPTARDLNPFQRQLFSEIRKRDSNYTVEQYLTDME